MRLVAVQEASTIYKKETFELPLTGIEPFDDENWQGRLLELKFSAE